MALIDTGMAVELDWLLALPLEGEALVTLWSAVEADLAAVTPQTPAARTAHAALQEARRTQQLLNLRGRCLDGDWLTALPPFIEQLGSGAQPLAAEETAWGLELLQELHCRLLDPNAPAWELPDGERAELLWQAHALLERLEPLPTDAPERLPVVIEQISRYGAIAWMSRQGGVARDRAIRLLLRLAWVNPDSHPWSLPALRERISAALQQQQSPAEPAESEAQPDAPWREAWLEQAILTLRDLEPQLHAWSVAQLQTMATASDGGDAGDERESGASRWTDAEAEHAMASGASIGQRIRLDLERLQGLPLDLPSRLTLWRALRTHQGGSLQTLEAPEADALDHELRRLLRLDQHNRCREQALRGDWPDAARLLASLLDEAETRKPTDPLVRLLPELLSPLLQQLLNGERPGPASPSSPEPEAQKPAALHPDDRAELLWQAHRGRQLIRSQAPEEADGLSEIAEPIARLGALTWLERLREAQEPAQHLMALIRSQTCLMALAETQQPCPDWVALALRDGLRDGMNWLGRGLEAADLLQWSEIYIARALPAAERQQAQLLLWPAEAALEVGQALRLAPFHAP